MQQSAVVLGQVTEVGIDPYADNKAVSRTVNHGDLELLHNGAVGPIRAGKLLRLNLVGLTGYRILKSADYYILFLVVNEADKFRVPSCVKAMLFSILK